MEEIEHGKSSLNLLLQQTYRNKTVVGVHYQYKGIDSHFLCDLTLTHPQFSLYSTSTGYKTKLGAANHAALLMTEQLNKQLDIIDIVLDRVNSSYFHVFSLAFILINCQGNRNLSLLCLAEVEFEARTEIRHHMGELVFFFFFYPYLGIIGLGRHLTIHRNVDV